MSDEKTNGSDDQFLKELESGIRKILRNKDATKADKLGAINAGVRLAAIKHRINGASGDESEGFFK